MGADISRSSGSGWFDRAVAYVCALAAVAVCLFAPSSAAAQVQTFFVNVPAVSEQRDAMELCRDRFTAALVRVGGFRANQDAVTQQSVTDCLGETASATAKRECEVSMANIEVDFLIVPAVRRLGDTWNWSVKALVPSQASSQVWGSDRRPSESDAAEAAYAACDALALEFACNQGTQAACSARFGTGPVLVAPGAAAGTRSGGGQPRQTLVSSSALDVLAPTPVVVSVWIDGREAGTSESQITGVPAGSHSVTLKAPGYSDHTERLAFVAGTPTELKSVRLIRTTASLVVTMVEPSVAAVYIDGRERGSTASVVEGIAPGERVVVLRAAGYQERSQRLTLEAGGEQILRGVRLDALPASLRIGVNIMGAELVVDGRVVGRSSGATDIVQIPSNSLLLEVRREGYITRAEVLSLEPGGAVDFDVNLRRGDGLEGTAACPRGFVRIEPGSFTMGRREHEKEHYTKIRDVDMTQHSVTVTRAFFMQTTEVTDAQWLETMGTIPSADQRCGTNCPVENITWWQAIEFANKLSRDENLPECYVEGELSSLNCLGYRLPTESEWEFAVRAGAEGPAPYNFFALTGWGNDETSRKREVATKQPNAWGLYDMLGNVAEWTGDWFGPYPQTGGWFSGLPSSLTDPAGPPSGGERVSRGGSYGSNFQYATMALRSAHPPNDHYQWLGLRLARTAP